MAIGSYPIAKESLTTAQNLISALADGLVTPGEFAARLPSDFREAVYREQEHRYLLEDAASAWREHSEFYLAGGHARYSFPWICEELVDRFEKSYDSNVDERYQWEYHVEQLCIDMQGGLEAA